jgi:lysophospholipase L1-like esterase
MSTTTNTAETPPQLQLHKPDEIKILAFGDSLTEGYTDFGTRFHPYGWALQASLKKLLPTLTQPTNSILPRPTKVTVDIEGQSGDCVLYSLDGEFEERLRDAAPAGEGKYDLIVILGGTNDLAYKMGKDLEGAEEIFTQGLKVLYNYVLQKTSASLLLMTVPERAIDTRDSELGRRAKASRLHLNDLIKKWVAEQKERVFVMDLAPMIPFPEDGAEYDETPFDESIWSPDGLHMSDGGYDYVGEQLAKVVHRLL